MFWKEAAFVHLLCELQEVELRASCEHVLEKRVVFKLYRESRQFVCQISVNFFVAYFSR